MKVKDFLEKFQGTNQRILKERSNLKYKIGDIVTVKVKIVDIDESDNMYQCSHLDGNKETDAMFFDDSDIINEQDEDKEFDFDEWCKENID